MITVEVFWILLSIQEMLSLLTLIDIPAKPIQESFGNPPDFSDADLCLHLS
jgi:hypothetical protein